MSHDCDHHAEHEHHGLKGPALARALDAAEGRCAATQARLTAPRRRVLELLLSADAPLKAYDLIAAYGGRGEPAKPPTVYRALEFLERLGFAHRIESLNAYVGCADPSHPHSGQFLICQCCRAVAELDDAAIAAAIEARARAAGFRCDSQTVEVRGQCPRCAAAGADTAHP